MTGHCHCQNVSVDFEPSRRAEDLEVRACTCSFCRRHGVRSASDPSGRVEFEVRDARALSRYRFGSKTADFLICARCGVYVGALVESNGHLYATVNVNVLEPPLLQEATSVSYEGETPESRIARRLSNWTPAQLVVRTTP